MAPAPGRHRLVKSGVHANFRILFFALLTRAYILTVTHINITTLVIIHEVKPNFIRYG